MSQDPFIGAIFLFAGNFAPRGFALCNGQIMSIAQNTALFSILGTTYGGNGQTTFGLPDLRGRAAVSAGQGPGLPNYDLGQVSGNNQVTLTIGQMPAHNHLVAGNTNGDTPAVNNTFVANDTRASPVYNNYAAASDGSKLNPQSISITGGSQPVDISNPTLAINYIIAINGIFPSRN